MNDSILFDIKILDIKIKKNINDIFKNIDVTLNPLKVRVLHYINENEYVTQKDLESIMIIPKSTLSEALTELEKNKLIIRENKNNNYKNNFIKLTNNGKKLCKQIKDEIDALDNNITKGISKHEMEEFKKVISKIMNNLEGGL